MPQMSALAEITYSKPDNGSPPQVDCAPPIYRFDITRADFSARPVWGILDIMVQFDLPRLTLLMYRVNLVKDLYEQRVTEGTGSQFPIQEEADMLVLLIKDLKEYGEDVGFIETITAAVTLQLRLAKQPEFHDSSAMAAEMRGVSAAIMKDICKHKFVTLNEAAAKYAFQEHPFGKAVSDNFPSATTDLVEAGNCLGVECNTAAAFHLMRAAEVGLWELGKDRQIPLALSSKIEFAEWGSIIGELETAIKAIQQWPNSPTKEDAHKFYNAALVEIRAFNDGWRRHSAHARPHMPKMENDEAIALWGHVFRFMNKLATKIGEGHHTPLIWT